MFIVCVCLLAGLPPLTWLDSSPPLQAQSNNDPLELVWSTTADFATGVAWGDYDGDGDLDLAVGGGVYDNNVGQLTTEAVWSASESFGIPAWGDYDGDGDLDLAVGGGVYRNDAGQLTSEAVWSASESFGIPAWGDYDGDGDLDLAIGNYDEPNRLYRNDNGQIADVAVWSSAETDLTLSIAWGDYDSDGDLDLAVGNVPEIGLVAPGGENRIYRNENGALGRQAFWSSAEGEYTTSIAWGDYDNDGDLDLAVGNGPYELEIQDNYVGGANQIYGNDNGVLSESATWESDEQDVTESIAWGDYDGDGDLDLIAGNSPLFFFLSDTEGGNNRLYQNNSGELATSATWSSPEVNETNSVAWGDIDGDGDLDLAVSNFDLGAQVQLYQNTAGLQPQIAVIDPESTSEYIGNGEQPASLAWGDYDNDKDLDLAVGYNSFGSPIRLYPNDTDQLTNLIWSSTGFKPSFSAKVAWGDYDGDRDLDLVVGGDGDFNRLFPNDDGQLNPESVWSPTEETFEDSIAWGDYDNDGDLDLAVGSYRPSSHRLYRNDDSELTTEAVWQSTEEDFAQSVAWGDYDNDGDLDLAVGNNGSNRLYRNEAGELQTEAVWSSGEEDFTTSIAWGDYDGDGDLDLAVGNRNGFERLYRNDNGQLAPTAVWSSAEADFTTSIAWSDYDGDGDLDLIVGNESTVRIHRNNNSALERTAGWSVTLAADALAVGDYDGDGDPDILTANRFGPPYYQLLELGRNDGSSLQPLPAIATQQPADLPAADFYATSTVLSDTQIAVPFTMMFLHNNTAKVQVSYSLNGGGDWQPALNPDGTDTITVPPPALALQDQGQLLVDGGGIADTLQTTGTDALDGLELDLTLDHQQNSQLTATLSAPWPEGETSTVTLFEGLTNDGASPVDMTFSDRGGTFEQTVIQPDGGLIEYASPTAPVVLPIDESAPPNNIFTSTLEITQAGAIVDVDVIGLTGGHDYIGDLVFRLRSPTNTEVQLSDPVCGSTAGEFTITFDDDADESITSLSDDFSACPPNGDYQPLEDLSQFVDETAQGTWVLEIEDIFPELDPGILWGWGLSITFEGGDTVEVSSDVVVPIPANNTQGNTIVASTLEITQTGTIADVDVTNLVGEHQNIQELVFVLRSPQGTTQVLIENICENEFVFDFDLNLDDEASQAYEAIPCPPTNGGTYQPLNRLTAFDGEEAQGTWTLFVKDSNPFSYRGKLDRWGLQITTAEGADIERVSKPSVPIRSVKTSIIASTLNISQTGLIADVDLIDLASAIEPVSGSIVTLRSPAGTEVTLLRDICSDEFADFDLNLDDEAPQAYATIPCPPTDGGTYQPGNPLATFDGEEVQGTWTLFVENSFFEEGGSLDSWGLRITTGEETIVKQLRPGTFQPEQPLAVFAGAPPGTPFTLTLSDTVTDGITGTLTSWGLHTGETQGNYTFTWDTFASGVFGQSDNVVLRFEAFPEPAAIVDGLPGPYQYASTTAQTFPFRVRGTQVQVVDAQGAPVPDAIVYRLPADQTTGGEPITNAASELFTTDAQGFLAGRGELQLGDQLFAIAPAPEQPPAAADELLPFTLYQTSGAPTELGVQSFTVAEPGVQQLVVTAENPLLLFDLDVSVEWDVSKDPNYLSQLQADLLRASEYLYDWSNGRAALGDILVSQNADNWAFAHITVHADNSLRPFAAQGGVVTTSTLDPDVPNVVYEPGQIAMGSAWNRYGDPSGSLADDWPVTLAHELGHYLFYLDDVYLGIGENSQLIAVDTCVNSPMGDVYTNPGSAEFYWDAVTWQQNCGQTLTNRTLGRTEWQNITTFYPAIPLPTAEQMGPNTLPFALTSVTIDAPITPTNVLDDPTFYLNYVGSGRPVASNQTEVYRQVDLDGNGSYDYIVAQGGPSGGQNRIKVHGAAPGDRLCAFDPLRQQFGCEVVTLGDDQLQMRADSTWRPVIQVSPVTSTTFDLDVTGISAGLDLVVIAYPEYGTALEPITLQATDEGYQGTIMFDDVSFYGYLQLSVDEPATETMPRRETVVAYSVGGNPGKRRNGSVDVRGGGGKRRNGSVDVRGGGGKRRNGSTEVRSGGANLRAGNSPVASADGQFILYTENPIVFAEGDFYVIQTMSSLPQLPPGRTPIGTGYNLIVAPETDPTTLTGSSVSFEYLGIDVIGAGLLDEELLAIYYWDGTTWTKLASTVDVFYNQVSAPSQGPGVYALFASQEQALPVVGWNQFVYQSGQDLPVAQALASITGAYQHVYQYAVQDTADPWKVYHPDWPTWALDLEVLVVDTIYTINVLEGVTIYFSPETGAAQPATDQTLSRDPPTTFYGTITGDSEWTPAAGQVVEAAVGDTVCGSSETRMHNTDVVYVIDVLANCGSGTMVTFTVDGVVLGPTGVWNNTQGGELHLVMAVPELEPTPTPDIPPATPTPEVPPAADPRVYLPLVWR